MNITIIGAGNMGRGIGLPFGSRWAFGYPLWIPIRKNQTKLAKELSSVWLKKGASAKAASLETVEHWVMWSSWQSGTGLNLEVAKKLGSKLAGKLVVDIANPLECHL